MRRNPYLLFGLVALFSAAVIAVLLLTNVPPLFAWLAAINLVALLLFRYDKMVSGTDKTRVPELILLFTVAAGGTGGAAIAMWVIRPRHKTRSGGFLAIFLLVLAAQALFLLRGLV